MEILQIANDYLGSGLYGLLFSRLEERGFASRVFVPVKYGTALTEQPEHIHVVPCFDQLDRLLYFRKQRKMLSWIRQNLNLDTVGLTHAHTVFSAGYAALQLKKKYGIPYIVAVRNTDVNVFFRRMPHLRRTGVEILEQAQRVIFLSPAYQETVLRDYVPLSRLEAIAAKCHVIPNGIHELFLTDQPQTHETGDTVRLIYVGYLDAKKNPDLTLEAVELLRRRGRQVSFTVVGQIREERYLPLLDKPYIHVFDRCPQQEVLEHLRNADIFVMPSRKETFGLVYAEAMSQGLPVIYTANQGFDGQFPEGEVGYRVDPDDAAALADKIEAIWADYARLSRNAIPAARRFDWRRIAGEYETVYRECCR